MSDKHETNSETNSVPTELSKSDLEEVIGGADPWRLTAEARDLQGAFQSVTQANRPKITFDFDTWVMGGSRPRGAAEIISRPAGLDQLLNGLVVKL